MKHKNETDKEKNELYILNRAIQLSGRKKKLTRDILSLMNGEIIDRKSNEKPDIIQKAYLSDGPVLIGIEHFLVEQLSESKGDHRESAIQKKHNHIEKTIENHKQGKIQSEQITRKIIGDTLFDTAVISNITTIQDLKESFFYSFDSHLAKVSEYRSNMSQLAEGKPFKLAFLIEISSNASNVFLNRGKSIEPRDNGIYPIFTWMVEAFEKINPKELDYIVLYQRNSINKNVEDVIAIDMKDVGGSFRKQGIVIYDYCNNIAQIEYQKHSISDTGFYYTTDIKNKDTVPSEIIPELRKAYEFKRNGVAFVAPREIQERMYAFGRAEFIETSEGVKVKSEFTKEETIQRFDFFTQVLYPIREAKTLAEKKEIQDS